MLIDKAYVECNCDKITIFFHLKNFTKIELSLTEKERKEGKTDFGLREIVRFQLGICYVKCEIPIRHSSGDNNLVVRYLEADILELSVNR